MTARLSTPPRARLGPPCPALDELDELLGMLRQLGRANPVQRAKLVSEIDRTVRAALARVGDEAVYQAAQTMRQRDIATHLGVSAARVSDRVAAYRGWLANRDSS